MVKTKKLLDLEELVSHVDEHYSGIYQSKQSYYDLFDSAEISWKKSHSCQPKVRSRISKKKEQKFKSFWLRTKWRLSSRSLAVFFGDECHLLWGDVCG